MNELDRDDVALSPSENKLSSILGLKTASALLAVVIIVLLFYLLLSGKLFRFYASALFLFYALTKKMWVSVMMLGVFQTLILIPVRIIRVLRQDNIKNFEKKIEELPTGGLRRQQFRDSFKMGNRTLLFYVVDFLVQLFTFLTIGRLFLTDFYSVRLNPNLLYSFVPYPQYPIQDTWFKIPYLAVTKTTSLGWQGVLGGWAVVLVGYLIFLVLRRVTRSWAAKNPDAQPPRAFSRYAGVSLIFIFAVVAFLLTHIPTGVQFRIFTGDVSVPNITLNTITAIATFGLLVWFGIPKIIRQGRKALEAGVPEPVVSKTQKEMFKETMLSAVAVGLGAFYITNHIPSAFELSVFTLEVISLASPVTLDRAILNINRNRQLSTAVTEPD